MNLAEQRELLINGVRDLYEFDLPAELLADDTVTLPAVAWCAGGLEGIVVIATPTHAAEGGTAALMVEITAYVNGEPFGEPKLLVAAQTI